MPSSEVLLLPSRSHWSRRGVLFASLCGLAAVAAHGDETPSTSPNVLLLICDDLNCDLGCYGHPLVQTPNIDRLAARGVRFANAFCQYPLCGPSRASMMCGLYPDQTLVQTNGAFIRNHVPDVRTLPQLFREHGYHAARIGKIFHYGVPSQIGTSGFDDPESWNQTINPRGRDVADQDQIFSVRPGEFGGYLSWLAAEGADAEQTDGIAATEAIRLIQGFIKDRRPFFLAVGLYRPHTPYVAPRRYFDMYPLEDIVVPTVPAGYFSTLPPGAQESITRKPEHYNLSPEMAREAIRAYYASVTFADAQIGRILDALERSGAAGNTLVVFTSDHGYHLGEHGHWLKTALFENAVRVPLIVAGPGVMSQGRSVDSLAELVDVYPTLAQLCGLPAPECLSGVSLAPALAEPTAAVRSSALSQLRDLHYTLRTAEYRYTEWGPGGSQGVELYDRRTDPTEMHNRANDIQYAETARRLAQELHARIAEGRQAPVGVQQIQNAKSKRETP